MDNNKKYGLLIIILLLSIGFAFLSTNLVIRGLIGYKASKWDVHFEDVDVIKNLDNASVPTINETKDTVDFNVQLGEPGEIFEFNVDVVNDGTIDAMISEIVKTGMDDNLSNYLDYTVNYINGDNLNEKDLLKASSRVRLNIKVEYKYNIDNLAPQEEHSFSFTLKYVRATEEANEVENIYYSETNNIVQINNAKANSLSNLKIYGNTEQTQYSGKNLLNYKDPNNNILLGTADNDGWITITKDNTNGENTSYSRYYINGMDLETDKKYLVVLEVKNVSGTGSLVVTDRMNYSNLNEGFFKDTVSYNFSDLSNNNVKTRVITTIDDFTGVKAQLRCHGSFSPGESGSITFRLSLLEDTSVTADNFNYEPYVGGIASPNPDYPQEVRSVKGDLDLGIYSTNLLNYNKIGSYAIGSGISIDEDDYIYDESPDNDSRSLSYEQANFYINLLPGTYTVSLNFLEKDTFVNDNNGLQVYSQDNKNLCAKDISNVNTATCTFTLDKSTNVGILVKAYNGKYRIQLEEGNKVTQWKPYKNYQISLGNIELNKLGNKKDYIYKKGNDWFVHKETNREQITISIRESISDTGYYRYATPLKNTLPAYIDGNIAYCNIASLLTYAATYRRKEGFTITDSGAAIFYFDDWSAKTLEEMKTYAEQNPIIVYYPLVSASDTKIIDETLISQLNAILNDNLFEGNNNVTINGSNLNPEIYFEYGKS